MIKLQTAHILQLGCTAVAAGLAILITKDPAHAIEWAAAVGLFAGAGNVLGLTSGSATAPSVETILAAAVKQAVADALKEAGVVAGLPSTLSSVASQAVDLGKIAK